MDTSTFTFRLDESLKEEFAKAAKSRDRTAAQLLRDFMRDFVNKEHKAAAHDAWVRQQVLKGLDDAQKGNIITADEVEAEALAWREAMAKNLAKVNVS